MHDDRKQSSPDLWILAYFPETQTEKLWETLLLRWWEYVKMYTVLKLYYL